MNRYADKYVIPYLTVLDRSKAQAKEKSARFLDSLETANATELQRNVQRK